MKLNDYIRLGRISIKSRKKTTRHTILGISFGLILLIPVFFLSLSFNSDIKRVVNENKSISSIQIKSTKNEEVIKTNEDFNNAISKNSLDILLGENSSLISEINSYEVIGFSSDSKYIIASKEYEVLEEANSDNPENSYYPEFKVIEHDKPVLNSYITDLNRNNKKFLAAGSNLSGGRKEILVSERFANKIGVSPEGLINKTITIKAKGFNNYYNSVVDNDNDPNNKFIKENLNLENEYFNIINDFTIKGVISLDYYRMNEITAVDSDLWIDINSVYDNGAIIGPIMNIIRIKNSFEENGPLVEALLNTYQEDLRTLENKAAQNGMLFFISPLVKFNYKSSYSVGSKVFKSAPLTTMIQPKSYNAGAKLHNIFKNNYKQSFNISDDHFEYAASPKAFTQFSLLNRAGNIAIIVLIIFGGVILLATLLNLYNSIQFSVEARYNYLGMMRAIGARSRVIPKLYLVENMLIFGYSMPWTIGFSAVICLGLKLVIENLFNNRASSLFSAVIRLSFSYYFIALIIVLLFSFTISLLFSIIACLNITKRNILDNLSNDK